MSLLFIGNVGSSEILVLGLIVVLIIAAIVIKKNRKKH